MNIKMLLQKRPYLPYADFVNEVNSFEFSSLVDGKLHEILRGSENTSERCAIIKEIIKRQTGLNLFDTQISTSRSLLNKRIAELPTGEGKTLSAVVAAICYALDGHRAHILVFNDYLAKRDYLENKAIYESCGVSVGYIDQYSAPHERKAAYKHSVTYVSAKEAGFDFLRDFLCQDSSEIVFPKFDVAIVDEADSILIDEGRTPLVLAGDIPYEKDRVKLIDSCIRKLDNDDVCVEKLENNVWLTDKGIDHMETMLGTTLYDEQNVEILAGVQNSLDAYFLLAKDVDYIVKDGAIQIIESTTGRVVVNKKYPDLLHRAVEVKEGLGPAPLTTILNSVTMRNFISQYPIVSGMTGTISTSADELDRSYGLQVDVIPPHTPCVRIDHPLNVYGTENEWRIAIVRQVQECYQKGQPVLVGTASVAESENLSAMLLQKNLPHVVLNAKNDEEEAKLIAHAGYPNRITISTNMAGRGVDIKLGGNDAAIHQKVIDAGGLYVVGAGINPCVRIDNQLRGRAGRQGDAGESQFFVCLENPEIINRVSACQRIRVEIGSQKLQQRTVRQIQMQMDGEAAQGRYTLAKYAHILELQRQSISRWRKELMAGRRMGYFATSRPRQYSCLISHVGEMGVHKAENQLLLYYINVHWADYLATMEVVRSGIHLVVFSTTGLHSVLYDRKSPLEEYHRAAMSAYEEMVQDIRKDVLLGMDGFTITKDGIDMDKEGLAGGTSTWTYAIDESTDQFSQFRRLAKYVNDGLTGEHGLITLIYKHIKKSKNRM